MEPATKLHEWMESIESHQKRNRGRCGDILKFCLNIFINVYLVVKGYSFRSGVMPCKPVIKIQIS